MTSILIVENEAASALTALKKLQALFSVAIMRTRGELVAQLPVITSPDIVLLDRELGDASGRSLRILYNYNDSLELISKIRQLHPCTKIIIWSSLDDQNFLEEARTAGANGFITKIRIKFLPEDIKIILAAESWVELLEDEA